MTKRFIVSLTLLIVFTFTIKAQAFSEHFEDKTLRIDYLWIGDALKQSIAIDEISCFPKWAGRRNNLATFPLVGDGELVMYSKKTRKCIYKTTFSSLFHEWLDLPEAKMITKGFEHTILLPFPKEKTSIQVKLFDNERNVRTELTHFIDPKDILIRKRKKSKHDFRYLVRNGEPKNCIDVVIVSEGYTQKEDSLFYQDANKAVQSLFYHEPLKSLQHHFNLIAVHVPSTDSGISHPKKGIWKQTAFNSHFDTFYSDRYLTTKNIKAIHNALTGIPYEHIIVLANTEQYGGGGIFNSFTITSTKHRAYMPVVVHEFGHSFAGLADEYFYEEDPYETIYSLSVEPWAQNITTLIDFDSKWKNLLDPRTPIPTPMNEKESYPIGVYEGAGYRANKIYRPADDCRMRSNFAPAFCPVCQRAIKQLIHFYIQEETQ
ncbi:MAG: peptidase M64 [Bacteroidales bacterium]|nr:peptidase M64 [Bacteroidales bacterium]